MIIKDIEELRQVNDEWQYRPHPLTDYQIKVLDNQLSSVHSTMWNNPFFLRFKAEAVDAMRLYDAANKMLYSHPVLNTRIFMDVNGEFKQQICPGFVRCQYKSVKEANMENILSKYPMKFQMINSPLSMIHIYETKEYVYFFIDAHHIITDATSGVMVIKDLAMLYKNLDCEIEEDLFVGFNILEQKYRETEEYQADREYYEQNYGNREWYNMPEPDFPLKDNMSGQCRMSLGVSIDELKAAERRCRTTRSRLANAAGLLALAKHSKKNSAMITWIYHNRAEKWRQNMTGLVIRELPIGVDISGLTILDDLYKSINKQMKESTKRTSYQYVVEHESTLMNDSMEINYKGSSIGLEKMFQYLGELGDTAERIPIEERIVEAEARLEIDIQEDENALPHDQVFINPIYIASIFKEKTINGFFELYRTMFQRLVKADKTTLISELLAD